MSLEAREPKRVVVTRSEPDDGPLCSELRALGLHVLLWPAVTVEMAEKAPLEAALQRAGTFDWIVFASRHAVAAVTEILAVAPPSVRIAAVGQATAHVLRQRGWRVDLVPSESNAAALVEAFVAVNTLVGARVLYPASSRALPTIAAALTQLGAEVVQVEAYRTESSSTLDVEECRAWIAKGGVGAVTFASPSAVDELEHALGKEDFARLLAGAAAVAIGPTTAKALSARGYAVALAESATLQGLAHTTHRLLKDRADGER
ncbi:MAG TPA: uroporphyrinogen-III synthase [Steroidobacteraceae bacterium]|nr:uroporphyrinogen-III synthase [Steroidobacteraceae bacterium]